MDWININDRKPKEWQKVIYYFKPLGTFFGEYTKGENGEDIFFGDHGWLTNDVTDWMPFPDPPEDVEKSEGG